MKNAHNKQRIASIIVAIIVIIVAALVYYGWDNAQKESPLSRQTKDIPIQKQFDNKIVYTTSQNVNETALKNHCESLNGTFKTCGSPCAPDADMCMQVCAYTCENIQKAVSSGSSK